MSKKTIAFIAFGEFLVILLLAGLYQLNSEYIFNLELRNNLQTAAGIIKRGVSEFEVRRGILPKAKSTELLLSENGGKQLKWSTEDNLGYLHTLLRLENESPKSRIELKVLLDGNGTVTDVFLDK